MTTASGSAELFAMIPEAVLYSGVSDGAVRLYGVLRRFADQEMKAWPSRRTLAERLGVSVDTLDRRLRELTDAGFSTGPRPTETANTLSTVSVFGCRGGAPTPAPPRPQRRGHPGRKSAAQNESHKNEKITPTHGFTRAATERGQEPTLPADLADRLAIEVRSRFRGLTREAFADEMRRRAGKLANFHRAAPDAPPSLLVDAVFDGQAAQVLATYVRRNQPHGDRQGLSEVARAALAELEARDEAEGGTR